MWLFCSCKWSVHLALIRRVVNTVKHGCYLLNYLICISFCNSMKLSFPRHLVMILAIRDVYRSGQSYFSNTLTLKNRNAT